MTDCALRPAASQDLAKARAMLAVEGLPTQDLCVENLAIVAEVSGILAGVIGLECFASRGLLRSLVVSRDFRGQGLGKELVIALENHARSIGIEELWLLTIDAEHWFRDIAFEPTERSAAPQDIRDTREFSSLCPGDAVLMRKALDR